MNGSLSLSTDTGQDGTTTGQTHEAVEDDQVDFEEFARGPLSSHRCSCRAFFNIRIGGQVVTRTHLSRIVKAPDRAHDNDSNGCESNETSAQGLQFGCKLDTAHGKDSHGRSEGQRRNGSPEGPQEPGVPPCVHIHVVSKGYGNYCRHCGVLHHVTRRHVRVVVSVDTLIND